MASMGFYLTMFKNFVYTCCIYLLGVKYESKSI